MPDPKSINENPEENKSEPKDKVTSAIDSLRPSIPQETKLPDESNLLLKNKYNLHKSEEVDAAAKRTQARTGEKVSQNPLDRIQNYLERFREINDREDPDHREHGVEAVKRLLYRKFIIKPEEVPESYFELQRRIAREQGHGDITVTEDMRKQLIEAIIADQKSRLDQWVDYLSSSDAPYSDALKYWTLRNVLNMSEYDKEKKSYPQRSIGTTKLFPDLNREALAYVLDAVEKKYRGQQKDLPSLAEEETEQFEKLLQGENFGKLYAWAIEKITPSDVKGLANISGQWVRYDRGSDHMPLVQSLQGHGTGWCTAGESTAQSQLEAGDFYVYYSYDSDGKATIPRVAIRMQENEIAEVRGIAENQNIDPYIDSVVEKKLEEFPDGKDYQKKVADMQRLTQIDNKVQKGMALDASELKFLYQIDGPIQGFGYEIDPRIAQLLESRDAMLLRSILEKTTNNQSLTPDDLKFLYQVDHEIHGFGDLENPHIKQLLQSRDVTADYYIIAKDSPDNYWVHANRVNAEDTVHLRSIIEKMNDDQSLTEDEIKFLYECDRPIQGFDIQKNPRIKELVAKRLKYNRDEDISLVFGCDPSRVAHSATEINVNTKIYFGDLEPGIFNKLRNLEHVYISSIQNELKFEAMKIGGKTPAELWSEYSRIKWYLRSTVTETEKNVFLNDDFKTEENPESIDMVKLSLNDIGLTDAEVNMAQIHENAFKLGLMACPQETGPRYFMDSVVQKLPPKNAVFFYMRGIHAQGQYRSSSNIFRVFNWGSDPHLQIHDIYTRNFRSEDQFYFRILKSTEQGETNIPSSD